MITNYDAWTDISKITDWDRFKLLVAGFHQIPLSTTQLQIYHIGFESDRMTNPQLYGVRYPDKTVLDLLMLGSGTRESILEHRAERYLRQRILTHSFCEIERRSEWKDFSDSDFPVVTITSYEANTKIVLLPSEPIMTEQKWMHQLAEMAVDPIIFDFWPWSEGIDGLGKDWEPDFVQIECRSKEGFDKTGHFIRDLVKEAHRQGFIRRDQIEEVVTVLSPR